MTIKTATVPKFKSPHPSEIVRESPVRTPSPISPPVITPVEGGELSSDDESPWEGFPQSNQRIYCDDLMDGIERTVRDTISEVFASRDEKEKKENLPLRRRSV